MKGFRDFLTEGKKPAVPHFEPANTATPVDKNKRKKHDRNVKEGAENLKELSTELLGRYKTAAKASASAADKAGDFKKGNKRFAGVNLATKKQFANDAKKLKEEDENLEEGWLFGSRYKRIGNKYATHRVTVKHGPTNTKHTFDVTAPTDRHAFDHVDRHMHGGRRGNTLTLVKIQHLHEGQLTEGENNLQELSIKKLNAYQSKATKEVRQIKSNSNYGAERGAKKLLANRIKGIARANKSRIAQSEELEEALDIRHAINHGDSQARHHARKYKASVIAMNSLGSADGASQEMANKFAHHYETAQYHHKEYKKRLKQLDAGKNEDLQEISKGLAARYLEKAKPAYDAKRKELNKPDHTGPVWGDMKGRIKKFSDQVDKLGRRREGINRAQARLKEEEGLQELSKKTLGSYVKKASRVYGGTMASVAASLGQQETGASVFARRDKQLHTVRKREKGIDRATDKLTKEDSDLQELSKATLQAYLPRARGNRNAAANRRDVADEKWEKANKSHRDGTAKTAHTGDYHRQTMKIQSSVSKAADRTIEKRTKGIAMARARLTKEDLGEGLVKKIVRAVSGRAEAARRAENSRIDIHTSRGNAFNSETPFGNKIEKSQQKMKRSWKAAQKYDKIATGKPGLKFGSRKSQKMDNIDQPMFRKPGSSARKFKTEDLDESKKKGLTVAVPVEIDGKKYSAVNGQAYVHSNMIMGRWNTQKRAMRKALKPGAHHDKVIAALEKHQSSRGLGEGIISRTLNAIKNANKRLTPTSERIAKTREKVGYDNAKGTDLRPRGKALRKVEKIEWAKTNPVKKPKDIVPMGKLPDKVWEETNLEEGGRIGGRYYSDEDDYQAAKRSGHYANEYRREKAYGWAKKTDDEKAYAVKRAARTDKLRATLAAKKKAASAAKRAERKKVRDHQKKMDSVKSPTGRAFGQDKPDTRSDYQKKLDAITDRIKNRPFGQTSEELEPKQGGSKFLKEKPKRDPKTGKLEKSKAAQKVEDCIKISGKKEKIDTEPTYNPLTTASNGSGSPNA